jgi:hypothetical protein
MSTPNGLLQNCTQHFHLGNDYLHHIYHHKYTHTQRFNTPGILSRWSYLVFAVNEAASWLEKLSMHKAVIYNTAVHPDHITTHLACHRTHPRSHGSIPVTSMWNVTSMCSTTWQTGRVFSSHFGVTLAINFWRRNFLLNFSTSCI